MDARPHEHRLSVEAADFFLRYQRLLCTLHRPDIDRSQAIGLLANLQALRAGPGMDEGPGEDIRRALARTDEQPNEISALLQRAARSSRLWRLTPVGLRRAGVMVACLDGPVSWRERPGGEAEVVGNLSASVPHQVHNMFRLLRTVIEPERLRWLALAPVAPADGSAVAIDVDGHPWSGRADRRGYVLEQVGVGDWVGLKSFVNGVLWPVFHMIATVPDSTDSGRGGWRIYRRVNSAVAARAAVWLNQSTSPLLQVHDFELLLVPGLIRRLAPGAVTMYFHRITWPTPDHWRSLSPEERRPLLEGALGADVVVFHTPADAARFTECVRDDLGSGVIVSDGVRFQDRDVHVLGLMQGLDVGEVVAKSRFPTAATARAVTRIKGPLRSSLYCLSAERLDVTKGILLRLAAIERFLASHPDWIGRVHFLQVVVAGRSYLPSVRELEASMRRQVDLINGRFGRHVDVVPGVPFDLAAALYADAPVFWVNSVADGLPLVAKDYVAARGTHPDGGALVLSWRAGVASEIHDALLIDPLDIAATAEGARHACELSAPARIRSMAAMFRNVIASDIYDFTREVVRLYVRTIERR